SRIAPGHRPAGPPAAPVLPAATPAACLRASAPDSPSVPSGVLVCVGHGRPCSRFPLPASRCFALRKLQAFTEGCPPPVPRATARKNGLSVPPVKRRVAFVANWLQVVGGVGAALA